jgi:hypothetical protein
MPAKELLFSGKSVSKSFFNLRTMRPVVITAGVLLFLAGALLFVRAAGIPTPLPSVVVVIYVAISTPRRRDDVRETEGDVEAGL